MGTKRRRNSKRQEESASNNRRPRMKKDVFERSVLYVVELERRNLRRASAVLASLSVSMEYLKDQIDAGDLADVARELIDGATDALDRVELERAARKAQLTEPP
jgi:hypothetical protein